MKYISHGWRGSVFFAMILFSTLASAAPMDGIWTAMGGQIMVALKERTDGRLVGYFPADPATRISSGSRSNSNVSFQMTSVDPGQTHSGTFSGTVSGDTLTGTYSDGGNSFSVSFTRTAASFSFERWLIRSMEIEDGSVRLGRVLNGAGGFSTGAFVGRKNCSFLACGGTVTAWSVSGSTHTITTSSNGNCSSTSTMTGPLDATKFMISGTYARTDCNSSSSGNFMGGPEGISTPSSVNDSLALLAEFADAIEAKDSTALNALISSTYLNDGATKSDLLNTFTSIFSNYNNLQVQIDAVAEIISDASNTNPVLTNPARIESHFSITGIPVWSTTAVSVMDVQAAIGSDDRFLWVGNENGHKVFIGNQFGADGIGLPIAAADSDHTAKGLWPFGVHGGGHPEGHPGWDIEYKPGTSVIAATGGIVVERDDNSKHPGTYSLHIKHKPGYVATYDELVNPLFDVGQTVKPGDILGSPNPESGGPNGTYLMIHFGLSIDTDTVCPLSALGTSGHSLFDTIWSQSHYAEELTEPMPCNPVGVTFPLTKTWNKVSGASTIQYYEFTRASATVYDYTYKLRNSSGTIVETGSVSLFDATSRMQLTSSSGAITYAMYDINSDHLWINTSTVAYPPSLSGATEYTVTNNFP